MLHVNDVHAILYIGSWARKEMSYTIENGDIKFLNDIDVLIITKDKIHKQNIKFLRDITSKAINEDYLSYEDYVATEGVHNFYVDIRNYCTEDLKGIIPRMKYYDIFTEPQPIYTKHNDVAGLFPKVTLNDIPLQDGLVHLFNRMALLIEWNPIVIRKNRDLIILVLKAYSAILEALLLIDKKYVISLKEKADIFHENYKTDFYELWQKHPDLADRINLMVDMKINYYKYHDKIDEDTVLSTWIYAKKDIMITTIYTINKIYKTNFELSLDPNNISAIINFLKGKNGFAISPYIKIYSKKKFGFEPEFLINLIYLLVRYRYFLKFNGSAVSKKHVNFISKVLGSTKEPTSQLYLAILPLLCGIGYTQDKVITNEELINIANTYLNNISLQKDIHSDIVEKFKEIFRTWELFTFEQ